MPTPKKTDSTMPMAVSSLRRLQRTMPRIASAPSEPGHQRAEEERQRLLRRGQEEAQADAGQRRVGQRVAQQTLATQEGVAAHHAADDAQQAGAEEDVAGGEV